MRKSKKKVKKKKRSVAWKNLEKYVAKRLSGLRINRALNYAQSLPDVVADGELLFGKKNLKIVVECKHSQNQPFVDLLTPHVKDENAVHIDDYIFFNFEDIEKVNSLPVSVLDDKTLPNYILDNYNQALNYDIRTLVNASLVYSNHLVIPIVVIAKKNNRTRIAYTKRSNIIDIYTKLL